MPRWPKKNAAEAVEQESEAKQVAEVEEREAPKAKGEKAPAKRYVTRTTVVDKHNRIRERVEVTPAVCPVCGLDLGRLNKFPPLEALTEKQLLVVEGLVHEHLDKIHTAAEVRQADAIAKALSEETKES